MTCNLANGEEHLCELRPGSEMDEITKVNRLLKDTYGGAHCFRG